MVTFRTTAPILLVRDLKTALDHYRRLGFAATAYDDADYYGFLERDGVQLHLAADPAHDPKTSPISLYLYIDDADALHTEWTSAGVDGKFGEPTDTPYGLREGWHIDPDGNLLRFGSPLPT